MFAGSDKLAEVGWYDDSEEGPKYDKYGDEVPCIDCAQRTANKRPTRWGLYDLSGNVEEWCWDAWGDYAAGAVTDPTGAPIDPSDPVRVLRGGSWSTCSEQARVASRGGLAAGDDCECTGLRLSRTLT